MELCPKYFVLCVYGFLPNKTESTYKRFLDVLLSPLPNAAPDKVLIDFELAAMKAFEKALPNASISGCFFHLSQNFIRKIGELGLKNLYDPELSLALKLSRRKKYRELEAKVKNAIERHQHENTIAFLRAMASLSMSN